MSITDKLIVFIVFSCLWSLGIIYLDSKKERKNINDEPETDKEENENNEILDDLSFKLIYPNGNLSDTDYDRLSEMTLSINSILKGKNEIPDEFIKSPRIQENKAISFVKNENKIIKDIDSFLRGENQEQESITKKKESIEIENQKP